MDCKECREQMSDALDSKLGDKEAAFNNHLDTCDECRKEYEEYKIMMQAIRDLPDVEVPEGFRNHWKEAVKEQEKGMLAVLPLHKRRVLRVAMGIAAAGLIAINLPNMIGMGNSEMLKDEAPLEMAMQEPEVPFGDVLEDSDGMGAEPAEEPMMFAAPAADEETEVTLKNASPEMAVTEENRMEPTYFIKEESLAAVKTYFEQKELSLVEVEENPEYLVYAVQLDAEGLSSWENFLTELGEKDEESENDVGTEETPSLVEIRVEIIQ